MCYGAAVYRHGSNSIVHMYVCMYRCMYMSSASLVGGHVYGYLLIVCRRDAACIECCTQLQNVHCKARLAWFQCLHIDKTKDGS